ncbi:MAG: DNA-binding protein [Candidatus Eremiobacteraeota bacterium]|nr:DNA-binding protein [Candidatus Eremiobacteraeota bacterium]
MRSKAFERQSSGRSYAVVLDIGDDALEQLGTFLAAERIDAAKLYGIGGFQKATLGYYDMEQKRYLTIEVNEQVEVLSFIGNVATYQGKPRLHVHCVVGHRDGRTTGGHLLTGVVRPTLELMIEELAEGLVRTDRPEIGIPLLAL